MVKPKSRMAESSCFFRIFSPKLHGNELKINPGFVNEYLKKVPDRMVLKCESGGPWPVRVVKTGNDVFLRHGWQEFVQDNSLQENNFLFFTYDGNAELAVQIFEDTGLERDYSAAASETHQEDDASPRVQNLGREARDPKEEINGDREERIRSFLSSCGNDLFEKQMRRHNVANPFTLVSFLYFPEHHP
ncbi:OLC1v1003072C1 [Oldenlandia corymbosa var. corymbosa]|uniref:OLC1v1003072C1 n=1 Tax=Oldenlandia corymbosa var. corymbosa TaxID=529605 RepID=A0AAV1D9V6_OLDCO|nr:OLC1v1003072C1 [Oldenlandia corymbosa var. corymbosa]